MEDQAYEIRPAEMAKHIRLGDGQKPSGTLTVAPTASHRFMVYLSDRGTPTINKGTIRVFFETPASPQDWAVVIAPMVLAGTGQSQRLSFVPGAVGLLPSDDKKQGCSEALVRAPAGGAHSLLLIVANLHRSADLPYAIGLHNHTACYAQCIADYQIDLKCQAPVVYNHCEQICASTCKDPMDYPGKCQPFVNKGDPCKCKGGW